MSRTISTAICGFAFLLTIAALKPEPVDPLVRVRARTHRFWVEKTFAESEYDLVVLGDSRVYRGVSPEELEKALPGLKALNFGYSSAGFTEILLNQGRAKLSSTADPRIIVLGISPWSLTAKAGENSHLKQELSRSFSERLERVYLSSLRASFSSMTPSSLRQNLQARPKPPKVLYHQIHHSNGWVESWKVPPNPREQLTAYIENFSKNLVSASIVNELVRQTESWIEEGILVFAFRLPTTSEMVALENKHSGFDEEQIRTRIEASGAVWIDVAEGDYESYDGSHLDRKSARRLSQKLGEKIAEHLK